MEKVITLKRIQGPLLLGHRTKPEPDVAVVVGEIRDYAGKHPTTAVLVIEVSDSTLKFDSARKAALYADAGIQEYWVLDLVNRLLEVYRRPRTVDLKGIEARFGHNYQIVTQYRDSQAVFPTGRSKLNSCGLGPSALAGTALLLREVLYPYDQNR